MDCFAGSSEISRRASVRRAKPGETFLVGIKNGRVARYVPKK